MKAVDRGEKFSSAVAIAGVWLTLINTISARNGDMVDAFARSLIGFAGLSFFAFAVGLCWGAIRNIFGSSEDEAEDEARERDADKEEPDSRPHNTEQLSLGGNENHQHCVDAKVPRYASICLAAYALAALIDRLWHEGAYIESLIVVLPVFIICLTLSVVVVGALMLLSMRLSSTRSISLIPIISAIALITWVGGGVTQNRALTLRQDRQTAEHASLSYNEMQLRDELDISDESAARIIAAISNEVEARYDVPWGERAWSRGIHRYVIGMPARLVSWTSRVFGNERVMEWGNRQWSEAISRSHLFPPNRKERYLDAKSIRIKAENAIAPNAHTVANSIKVRFPRNSRISAMEFDMPAVMRRVYTYECQEDVEGETVFYSLHAATRLDGKPIRYAEDELTAGLEGFIVGYLFSMGVEPELIELSGMRFFKGHPAIHYTIDHDDLYGAGMSTLINGIHIRVDVLCAAKSKSHAIERYDEMVESIRPLEY